MKKLIQKPVIILLVFLVILSLASSQEGVDWTKTEAISKDNFEDNFMKDPMGAFNNAPENAWELLGNKPNLMENPKILDAAFNNNPSRAAGVINKNSYLLKNKQVLDRFDLEAQKNVHTILNNNADAKAEWFKQKYKITDEGVQISFYDGKKVTTIGLKGGTFNIGDFEGAIAHEDGSITTAEGHHFAETKDLSKIQVDGRATYKMEGGIVNVKVDVSLLSLLVDSGGEIYLEKQGKDGEFDLSYQSIEGSFHYIRDQEGELITDIKGEVGRTYSKNYPEFKIIVTNFASITQGELFDPKGSEPGEFILSGNADLKFPDGTTLTFKGKSDSRIYYSEEFTRDPFGKKIYQAENFCKAAHSCILNTPRYFADRRYRSGLEFLNVQNNDQITIKTPVYYDQVKVKDLQSGEVNFVSLADKGEEKSRIIVNSGRKPKTTGNLAQTNAGRFDVFYTEEGKEKMYHWSSNEIQKKEVADYFKKSRNSFASCEIGTNCEEIFAKAFGKVIMPKGKRPTTTIIIGGDNAETAKSLQRYCKTNGCYILNSRDVPPTTQSTDLVITGHHFEKTGYIWRDPPEALGTHNPIDRFYFDNLPSGPVKSITFSACNSVTGESEELEGLLKTYPNLEFVQGYEGTAPFYDFLKKPGRMGEVKPYSWGKTELGMPKGERRWYVYQKPPGQWYLTNGAGIFSEVKI